MDKCCVYELTFANGKGYIGVTRDMKMRMHAHMHADSLIGKACRKHGRPNVRVLLIGEREYCYEMERRLIEQKQTLSPYGYNLMTGDSGNARHSEESRIKMGNAVRGKKLTEEHKKKISKKLKGRTISIVSRLKMSQAQLGKKHSIETKKKISIAALTENMSPENRRKKSEAAKGKIISTETRKKISESLTGRSKSPKILENMVIAQRARRARERQANG